MNSVRVPQLSRTLFTNFVINSKLAGVRERRLYSVVSLAAI